MGYKIVQIEGIGAAFAKKLGKADISTTDDLLDKCCTAKGRKQISSMTGLSGAQLLTWTNLADLMRIIGVGPQYSELLEAAGVDTVKELKQRSPKKLLIKMKEMNERKKLTRAVPSEKAITRWVAQAKSMPPKITY
jgi:predicted flap endonuclease-1-like 5' DNA nuclease